MLISMNWIQDFVDLSGLDLDALIQRFTLSTAEVEEVFRMGENLRDAVPEPLPTLWKGLEPKLYFAHTSAWAEFIF